MRELAAAEKAPYATSSAGVSRGRVGREYRGIASHYDIANACNVAVRWPCRTEVCHTCETTLIAGTVDYNPDSQLKRKEDVMEFLVEFEVEVPNGTPETEVEERTLAEASAAARLVDEGHLLRLWRRAAVADDTTAIGLYAADSEAQLDGLLGALPLADWMQVTIIPLAPHPNDPALVAR
jgi:muconolactone D-isomerase